MEALLPLLLMSGMGNSSAAPTGTLGAVMAYQGQQELHKTLNRSVVGAADASRITHYQRGVEFLKNNGITDAVERKAYLDKCAERDAAYDRIMYS